MKRNSNFLMQDVAGTLVVVPVGEAAVSFKGMLTLNAVGAYIWELLENEQTLQSLTDALVERYEVAAEIAGADVEVFLGKLREAGALTE